MTDLKDRQHRPPGKQPVPPRHLQGQGLPEQTRLEASLSQHRVAEGTQGCHSDGVFLLPWIIATSQPILTVTRRQPGVSGSTQNVQAASFPLTALLCPMACDLTMQA